MTVTLPSSLPTPISSGRWNDKTSSAQSTVVVSPAVTLPSGAAWFLQGGTSSGSLTEIAAGAWSGPTSATDGSGNPVFTFTVTAVNGTPVDRYTAYYYKVGMRDIGTPAHVVLSNVSGGGYPTNGWNQGTAIVPNTVANPNANPPYSLTWNAITGVDFSGSYVVQRALGTKVPPGTVSPGNNYLGNNYSPSGKESDTLATLGITSGFSTYTTTTSTTLSPLPIINNNPNEWTWFRVLAYSTLFGYTGVVDGSLVSHWLGVPNDATRYQVDSTTSPVVVGEPTAPSSAKGSEIIDGVTASALPLETNLPMLKTGIGGVSHPAAANRTSLHPGTPRWRDGMLVLNADQSVSQSVYSRRWGFRFHYNPSTWSQNTLMAQDIDLTKYSQTGGNLLVPSTFASVSLTIYLNRIIELSTDIAPDDPFGISQRARTLAAGDFYLGSGDMTPQASIAPVVVDDPYFETNGLPVKSSYSGGKGTGATSVEDKVAEVLRKGTLADLEYLYRAANGDPRGVTYTDEKTADIGMLGMTPMDLYLGPGIKYTVRVRSMSVQHAMFSSRMIPMFSEVVLDMVRGITLKDSTVDTVGLIANTTSWTGSGS